MRFDIITIFPEIFDCYFKQSLLKKAQEKGVAKVQVHDLRDFATDKHKSVDDKPFGGGRGMVLKIDPVWRCISTLTDFSQSKKQDPKSFNFLRSQEIETFGKSKKKTKIVLFTPRGKKFNQKMATQFSKLDQLILICGRYEGVDERVAKHIADEKISIGDYVLMGGELPALVVVETVSRLLPGVIGKSELLKDRITKGKGFLEYPQYTRPEIFKAGKESKAWKVPKVLLSGNHKEIEKWRAKHSKVIE